jgi:cytochrome c
MRIKPHLWIACSALLCMSCRSSFDNQAAALTGGDPGAGIAAARRYGCGSCHTIPRVPGANGQVGPSLALIGGRRYVAGELPNTPDNLVHWIQHPRQINNRTAMPELGVTETDARDIAALLTTLNEKN